MPKSEKPEPASALVPPVRLSAAEIAVHGYLIAKKYNLEWRPKFYRACKEKAYAKQFFKALAKDAHTSELTRGGVAQPDIFIDKWPNWAALREILAYSSYRREKRTPLLPTVSEITDLLQRNFRKKLKVGPASEDVLLLCSLWITQLNSGRLSAGDAGKIIVAWRKDRGVAAKRASLAAAAAKRAKSIGRARLHRAKVERRRLARLARRIKAANIEQPINKSRAVIAVLCYLVAKSYRLEWKSEFHRACVDQNYARKVLEALVFEVTQKMKSSADVRRFRSAIISVGWKALREMLTFSTRERERKAGARRILKKAIITGFLEREFRSPNYDKLVRKLATRKLTALVAGRLIDSWRRNRAVNPTKASAAAAEARAKNKLIDDQRKFEKSSGIWRSDPGKTEIKHDRSGSGYLDRT